MENIGNARSNLIGFKYKFCGWKDNLVIEFDGKISSRQEIGNLMN